MSFSSLGFLAFFAVAVAAFWLAPPRTRRWLLLAAGFLYMGSWGAASLATLCAVTLLTWLCGAALSRAKAAQARRLFLVLGLVCSAGYLFARKGLGLAAPQISLIAAVGLAFYALQAAAYLADVYAGRCAAQSLPDYAVYITFFPRIVSGPIGRAAAFFPQLEALPQRRFDPAAARAGLVLMLCGYAQKLILADPLAVVVSSVFDHAADYGGASVVVAILAEGFALYYDFAGYSAIAIGAAGVLGFALAPNFNRPYFAQTFGEFWGRWHISLSSWLRDYIYIPLGGNRHGQLRKYLNLVAVFALSGLWHGTGWQYIFWGGLHAFYQIFGDITKPMRLNLRKTLPTAGQGAVFVWLRRLFVLLAADFAWLFFRAANLQTAFALLASVFTRGGSGGLHRLGLSGAVLAVVAAALGVAFVLALLAEHAQNAGTTLYARFCGLPRPLQTALLLGLAVAVLLFGCRGVGADAAAFYYAQF